MEFGMSNQMGPNLRSFVEKQLAKDLRNYKIEKGNLRFDWSESCTEGHQLNYLDGILENFSGIAIFDESDNFIGSGWMEFVHGDKFILIYWEFIKTWENGKKLAAKKEIGIPDHIWEHIPEELKPKWKNFKMKIKNTNVQH